MSLYGIGSATGKIILMGEHSVVYGKPAIAIPFSDAKIDTHVSFHDQETTIDCVFYKGLLNDAPVVLDGIHELINVTLNYLQKPNKGLHILIHSSLPPQRGLGSSAAVSVSIVRGLFDAFKVPLSDRDLTYLVNVAEQIHHNNPSGLDANTIASGKAIFFERGKHQEIINVELDGVLVVADTGESGRTKEAVAAVREQIEANPEYVQKLMNRLGDLTHLTKEYLMTKNLIELGHCMNEAHQVLKNIQVSNDSLDSLIEVARFSGALGAKLTGSGKGGCIIALCENETIASFVSSELKRAGAANTWSYTLKGSECV